MSAALAIRSGPAREFAFQEADRRAIAEMTYREVGILLPEEKAQMVYGRLAPRARARGLDSIAAYVTLISRDVEERARAIDALTTNHTSFFRENHHFDDFVNRRWPGLSRKLAEGGRVRLWSAACSTGEEAYSWLMALLGSDRRAARQVLKGDLRMLATDVSASALAAARAGRYRREATAPVPATLRATWFGADGGTAAIDPLLRGAIAFRRLNLLREWPITTRFDAIFCRNVMIYFDHVAKAELQARLADRLEPGGMLYIGHSERLLGGVARRFEAVGRTAYQKVAT